MPRTNVRGEQVKDADIDRDDIDTLTLGKALITKVVAGTGIEISSTGADAGTGDVTINAISSGVRAWFLS